jgi:hypothetical protein
MQTLIGMDESLWVRYTYLIEQVARQAGMMNRQQVPQLVGDANRVLVGR